MFEIYITLDLLYNNVWVPLYKISDVGAVPAAHLHYQLNLPPQQILPILYGEFGDHIYDFDDFLSRDSVLPTCFE